MNFTTLKKILLRLYFSYVKEHLSKIIISLFLSIIVGQLKSSWHSSGEMIKAIRTGEINKYLIVGHTDTKGTKNYNINLHKNFCG